MLKSNNFREWDSEYKSSEKNIDNIEKLLTQRRYELSLIEYEVGVLEEKQLATYKEEVFYIVSEFVEPAMKWVNALRDGTINGEKLDKRKNYAERDNYNHLLKLMKKYIGIEDLSVDRISYLGYDNQAFWIDFNALNRKWMLEIPIIKNISLKILKYYGNKVFKITIYNRDTESRIAYVCSTFNEDELAELFEKNRKKFMEEE